MILICEIRLKSGQSVFVCVCVVRFPFLHSLCTHCLHTLLRNFSIFFLYFYFVVQLLFKSTEWEEVVRGLWQCGMRFLPSWRVRVRHSRHTHAHTQSYYTYDCNECHSGKKVYILFWILNFPFNYFRSFHLFWLLAFCAVQLVQHISNWNRVE